MKTFILCNLKISEFYILGVYLYDFDYQYTIDIIVTIIIFDFDYKYTYIVYVVNFCVSFVDFTKFERW